MKTFCLTASQCRKITKVPFWCFKKFLVVLKFSDAAYLPGAKVLLKHEGSYKKRCRNLFVSRKISLLCLGKFPGTKSFTDKQEGMTIFPYNFFLSQYRFFFRRGTLLRFRRILVSENFMDKRAGGREYYNFPSKMFCLTVVKNFEEVRFGVSEELWCRKFSCIKRIIRIFRRIFLISQY